MSRYFRAEILENRPLNGNHNLLSLKGPGPLTEALPGQFFMVGAAGSHDPLLKRPFSLFRKTSGGFEILYRISGKGTALLREMKKGAVVELLGPLGNGYPPAPDGFSPIVLAGGIGIASVYPLIEGLRGAARVFYGARTGEELFMTEQLRLICPDLRICTDDGSCGRGGTVIDLLADFLGAASPMEKYVIYACGPRPVLEKVSGMVDEGRIKAYVSLEEHMACGIGACLGCVTQTKTGYRRVCKEGPVFDAVEILW